MKRRDGDAEDAQDAELDEEPDDEPDPQAAPAGAEPVAAVGDPAVAGEDGEPEERRGREADGGPHRDGAQEAGHRVLAAGRG